MSRQIGSGAEEIADRLREELGLVAFDRRLMAQVAQEIGLAEGEIVDYSEDQYELRSFLDTLILLTHPLTELSSQTGDTQGDYEREMLGLDEEWAIELIRVTIGVAYQRDNVLIIGRGGQAILGDKPDVLHTRIVAPLESRVQRLQSQHQITPEQAQHLIDDRDQATVEYLSTFHHMDVDDPTLYHLVLNTGRLGLDDCVELIKAAVQGVAPRADSAPME
jgi:cytidylate kinase